VFRRLRTIEAGFLEFLERPHDRSVILGLLHLGKMQGHVSRVQHEYPGLRRFLSAFGLDLATGTQNEPPLLVVGWSSRSALLRRPEFAILSLTSVAYLQLPKSLREIRESIFEASSSPVQRAGATELTQPVGQWRWALRSLQEVLITNNNREALLRVSELQTFVRKHWPGWYEEVLRSIKAAVEKELPDIGTIATMMDLATEVALIHSCIPIVDWLEGERNFNKLAPMLDALCYASQGMLQIDAVAKYIARNGWWRDFESDLFGAEQAVKTLLDEESTHEVTDHLASLRRCVTEIDTFGRKQLANVASEEIDCAYSAVRTLVCELSVLLNARDRVRASLLNTIREI
jgi:hypothetical protein